MEVIGYCYHDDGDDNDDDADDDDGDDDDGGDDDDYDDDDEGEPSMIWVGGNRIL